MPHFLTWTSLFAHVFSEIGGNNHIPVERNTALEKAQANKIA